MLILWCLLLTCTNFVALGEELELTKPHLVIIGPTGSGKSTLGNSLIGVDPRCEDCQFPVCPDWDSCTKTTTYAVSPWLGNITNSNFTVVDTPGFGDSNDEMEDLLEEMMTVLNEDVKTANSLLLLIKATETRFNDAMSTMIHEMEAMFGKRMWNYTIIGISFFPYDEQSIEHREYECEHYPNDCKNEEWFGKEINDQLEERFHIGFELPMCFVDAWSQTDEHINDPTEQLHWHEETEKLWKFTVSKDDFSFKTIDDVLLENEAMRAEIKWLNDIITENITKLQEDLTNLDVKTEMKDDHLSDQIEDTITELDNFEQGTLDSLAGLDENLANEIADRTNGQDTLNDKLSKETSDRTVADSALQKEFQDNVNELDKFPVGTIISIWTKSVPSEKWVPCNGQTVEVGQFKGSAAPDLNSARRFLRGSSSPGGMEAADVSLKGVTFAAHTTGGTYDDIYYNGIYSGCGADAVFMNFDVKNDGDNNNYDCIKKKSLPQMSVSITANSGQETRPINMGTYFVLKVLA